MDARLNRMSGALPPDTEIVMGRPFAVPAPHVVRLQDLLREPEAVA